MSEKTTRKKTIYKKNPVELKDEELENIISHLNEKLANMKKNINRNEKIPETYYFLKREFDALLQEKQRRNREKFIMRIQNIKEEFEEDGCVALESDPILSAAEKKETFSDVDSEWNEEWEE